MKRKTTKLEGKLIENGYILSFKNYQGKHSEKTLSYTYLKGEMFIELDQKREKIINYGLLNVNFPSFTLLELDTLTEDFDNLDTFVKNLQYQSDNNFEQEQKKFFVVEDDDPSDSEQTPNGMTPEQWDELCQEKEKQHHYEEYEELEK